MAQDELDAQEISGEELEEGYQLPYEGTILLSWMIDEYAAHDRGPLWYGAAATLALGLLVFAIITQNFLFAVIVIMFGVLIGLTSMRHPDKIPFVVTDLGVGIGYRFYSYKEFKSFWMVYEPPDVKKLYVDFRRSVMPHLVVPLDDQNPLEIRQSLSRYLREDLTQEDEPFADWLARVFKI